MKPLLYHDIDGVLFGEYGPRKVAQLRPGIHDWFHWASARYQIVFLTSWTEDELSHLFVSLFLTSLLHNSRVLLWETVGLTKWEALKRDQDHHPHPFFWIDDQPQYVFPDARTRSHYYAGLPFVSVNPTGAHQLEDLMQRLNARQTKLAHWLARTPSTPVLPTC